MTQASLDANDRDIWEWLALRAEVRLQAQLSAAIAADQRAMVWSGLLAAAAAALASAASVCLTSSPPKIGLGYTAVVGCGGLLIGLLFAVLAARPSRWFYPGSLPSAWISDIRTRKPQAQAMQEFCDDLSDMICKNERLMADNGKMLMLSVYLTVATLFGCVISIGKNNLWRVRSSAGEARTPRPASPASTSVRACRSRYGGGPRDPGLRRRTRPI